MNKLAEFLSMYYEEVSPGEFYRDIFPLNDLQKKGIFEKHKYNAVIVEINDKCKKNQIHRHTVTDDLEKINEVIKRDNFCLMSPISYVGKSRESKNARCLYALAIDLDGLQTSEKFPDHGIDALFYQFDKIERLPKPTYVVASGSGLHLYYVFEKPVMLFPNVVKKLQAFKRELTERVWFDDITSLWNKIQYESLFQGFRVVGTITKKGERTKAFLTGKKVNFEYLNRFVYHTHVTDISYKSDLTLAQAKEKYPEWYEKRIIKKVKKGTWTTKRDLYDWWKRTILEKGSVGHRYYCLMCLAVYAKKAGIGLKELEKDSYEVWEAFTKKKAPKDNPLTKKDLLDSLEAYNDNYITYPVNSISHVSGIRIDKNKRNGRTQKKHLEGARAIRDINNPDWREGNGRPIKKNIVLDWRARNYNGTKAQCIRETGLSKMTVYKWW